MHPEAYEFIEQQTTSMGRVGFVLEFGSRNVNGSIRRLFDAERYVGVDMRPGLDVDVVADAATYQPDDEPNVIVCCEVLEHAPQAEAIVAHALSLLPSGGVLLLTAAGPERSPHSAVDGGQLRSGEYYGNISPADLEAWLLGIAESKIVHNPQAGDVYAKAVKA